MRIDVVTLFPDFMRQCAAVGVVGRAQQRELLQVEAWNPRDYATDSYRTVDGRTCGGGPGMVMLIEPLRAALKAMREAAPEPVHVIYLSPQGARLTQAEWKRWPSCRESLCCVDVTKVWTSVCWRTRLTKSYPSAIMCCPAAS